MDSLDIINEDLDNVVEPRFLKGLPRQCKHCGKWAHHKRPKGSKECFSVECPNCNKEFDIIPGMKGVRS